MIYNCSKFIQSIIGSSCLHCHASNIHSPLLLCPYCIDALQINHYPCISCAFPMTSSDLQCGHCQAKPPHYQMAFAPYLYQGIIQSLILKLKSSKQLSASRTLAELFIYQLKLTDSYKDSILLPVPAHNSRLRQRGFNPTLEICRLIARKTGISLQARLAHRILAHQSQQGLKRKQRLVNVKNNFTVKPSVKGQNIIIFDDVMTSGATVNELSKTVLKAGAKSVKVWAIARTPLVKV